MITAALPAAQWPGSSAAAVTTASSTAADDNLEPPAGRQSAPVMAELRQLAVLCAYGGMLQLEGAAADPRPAEQQLGFW